MQMLYLIISVLVGFSDAALLSTALSSRGTGCAELTGILNDNKTGFFVTNLGPDCIYLQSPQSYSLAGGYCLASMVAAGWYRAPAVNPLLELVLGIKMGGNAMVTATNSGGTMYGVRYFIWRRASQQNTWTYPCYMLTEPFRTVCFFHGPFGLISEECDADIMNVMQVSSNVVMSGMMAMYGGPLGAVSSYCSVYFPFLYNLPISPEDTNLVKFWTKFGDYNTFLKTATAWTLASSVINPIEASSGSNSFNYGFNSWLARGMNPAVEGHYSNYTVYYASSVSANTPSGFVALPFAFSGSSWDMLSGSNIISPVSSSLKLMGMGLSFLMMKKAMMMHQIVYSRAIPNCEKNGCPTMDGGFTDNTPLIVALATTAKIPENVRPTQFSTLGPASTMSTIKYLLGAGPLSVWTLTGLNMCPFSQSNVCRILTQVRTLVVPVLPQEMRESYVQISSNYGVWRPHLQAISTYCGDPLIFDHFQSICMSDSICYMWVQAVPSVINTIAFSISNLVFTLMMLWLAPSPLASRFVEGFIPNQVLTMSYYRNMGTWFPDFVAIAPQKGGMGFTKPAGHSLLDYLTSLTVRLMNNVVAMRQVGAFFHVGVLPRCGYNIYIAATKFNQMK